MSGFEELNGQQKVAIVMAQLSTPTSSVLMKTLGNEDAIMVATAIARLPPLHRDVVDQVLEEFVSRVNTTRAIGQGGVAQARKMLASVIGEQQALDVMSHHEGNLAVGPLALISQTEPSRVVTQLAEEHPQTIAAILAHVAPNDGARLLDAVPAAMRPEVAMRIATMGRVSPDAVSAAAAELAGHLRASGSAGASTPGGIPALVDLLSRSEGSTEKLVLGGLADRDPELAEALRAQMFTFDDVLELDDRTLQVVLRSVEISELALALRGISDNPDAVNKFTQNLSERGQAELAEEMEVLGSVRASQVDAAQSSLVRSVRDLEASGAIVITRSTDELV